MLSCFSHVRLFATLWSVAPDSSVHGFLQARIMEWVTMPSSRRIFLTQRLIPGLLHYRRVLYHWVPGEPPPPHRYVFIAILYTVFCFFLQFFIIPLFFFDLFPCDLINTFSGMLGFLSFACVCVCVSILIWGFGYYEDYIQQPIYLYMVKLIHS